MTAPCGLSEATACKYTARFGLYTSVAPPRAALVLGRTEYVATYDRKESAMISDGTILDSAPGEVNFQPWCSKNCLLATKRDFLGRAGRMEGDTEKD